MKNIEDINSINTLYIWKLSKYFFLFITFTKCKPIYITLKIAGNISA